ncbi:LysR family transcriptional regulator [Herbaspirillum rubrisubalbicans]|uniref:LysR family transcriptional regulator n=1 Tax=Herbaspirillum rubrisubalbicans TaxID=80842 RepID=UPI000B0E69E2|nr:LysR family transcriptional regulator [Herbaspirillum rubrisubalbicans]
MRPDSSASPRPPLSPLSSERMDWNLLRTFMFVVQERGVGRAASTLCLSQPAVSQALRRLEEAVGGILLHRRHGEFRLTPLGEEIYAVAREMYGMVARIDGAAGHAGEDVAGHLRLLLMSRVQSAAYDDFLARFHRRYPRVEFRIEVMQSAAILDTLAKGSSGLGLCLCRKPVEKLERRLFLRHRYVLVCGRHHPLFAQRSVSMAELLEQNFVCFASDQLGDTLSPLTVFRDQQGFTGHIAGTSPHVEEIRRMVVAGVGLSFLPEHLIGQDVTDGLLKVLPLGAPVAEIDVFLTWHGQRKLSAPEQAFLGSFERFLQRVPLEARTA